jgi:thioester reductase-like protein
MAVDLIATLTAARDAILTELASITTDIIPHSIDGQSFSSTRRSVLLADLAKINEQLDAQGWEVLTEVDT